MKRFLPLILSFVLTAVLACVVAWRQQVRIAGLHEKIASRPALTIPLAAPAEQVMADVPPVPIATDSFVILSRTKSRSLLRTAQELMRYYKTCPVEELRMAVEEMGAPGRINSLEAAGTFVIALSALSERDHAAAVEVLGKLKGDALMPAVVIVLNDWLLRDRKAALAWFHAMKDSNSKGQFLVAATVFYGNSNPQLVAELRNGISESSVLEKAVNKSVEALASTDPEAALARLDEITDVNLRERARTEALMVFSAKEPQKALEMMLEAAPDGQRIHDRQIAQALLQFALKDKVAATQWMARQDAAVITRLFTAEPQLAAAAAKEK